MKSLDFKIFSQDRKWFIVKFAEDYKAGLVGKELFGYHSTRRTALQEIKSETAKENILIDINSKRYILTFEGYEPILTKSV